MLQYPRRMIDQPTENTIKYSLGVAQQIYITLLGGLGLERRNTPVGPKFNISRPSQRGHPLHALSLL